MKHKNIKNLYIVKKYNQNKKQQAEEKNLSATEHRVGRLVPWVVVLSVVFLYSQILQTVDGNSALTITILRSFQISEIPLVIFPYLILVTILMLFSLVIPILVSILGIKHYSHLKNRGIKFKAIITLITAIICFIYGLIGSLVFISLFGFIYGAGFIDSYDDLGLLGTLKFSFLVSIPSFVILLGVIPGLGDIPLADEISQKIGRGGWKSSLFDMGIISLLALMLFSTITLPQPVNDFTDTRSCIKFIDGYNPYSKEFKASQQNIAYFITGYTLGDSGATLSIATTSIGINPDDATDFRNDFKIIYAKKELIEFVKPERCGAYLNYLYKNSYFK